MIVFALTQEKLGSAARNLMIFEKWECRRMTSGKNQRWLLDASREFLTRHSVLQLIRTIRDKFSLDSCQECLLKGDPKSSKSDYVKLLCIGVLPSFVAWMINAHVNVTTAAGVEYVGFWKRPNWIITTLVILPSSLWVLRRSGQYLYGFHTDPAPTTPDKAITRIYDIFNRDVKQAKYCLQQRATAGRNLLVCLVVVFGLHVMDMWDVGRAFLHAPNHGIAAGDYEPYEKDWSVFFWIEGESGVGWWQNLVLVLSAYLCQALVAVIGVSFMIMVFTHNRFYLGSIYQRRRQSYATKGQIVLDFDNHDDAFGLRRVNRIFNSQIACLVIAGFFIFSSRVYNVYNSATMPALQLLPTDMGAFLDELKKLIVSLPLAQSFEDAGQVALAVIWLICFAFASAPGFVKFIAWCRWDVLDIGSVEYVQEYVEPSHKEYGGDLDANMAQQLCDNFVNGAFWPSGNNVAKVLYAFAYFVFFWILVPPNAYSNLHFSSYCFGFLGCAVALMFATFKVLEFVLWIVSSRLVKASNSR